MRELFIDLMLQASYLPASFWDKAPKNRELYELKTTAYLFS